MMKGMDKLRYQRDFLNIRPIFTAGEQEYLTELSDRLPLSVLTDSVRNIEEIGIDFVYSPAKLEGNTYNQYDTQALLKLGQTAGGKLYSDAVMLINLRESYRHLLSGLDSPKPFDWLDFLKTTHSLISENLLEKGSGGVVRRDSVTISGTDYTPLSNPQSLDTELKWLLQEAPKIENPFDRAVYLHNNLAYLRYFKDCNKRTARNCMTLSLMRSGFFPCVFSPNSYPAYAEAVVAYYETGDYGLFKKYFISAYENTVNKYGPQPDVDIFRNFSI